MKPSSIETLALREWFCDRYFRERDPIAADRMFWRAHSFRQLVHLLPGQSILELACGGGTFTRQLARVSRGENPIVGVTFQDGLWEGDIPASVSLVRAETLPGPLEGRTFDYVVATDLLDKRNCAEVLRQVFDLLSPGGEVVFYESNPWNVVLKARQLVGGLFGRRDPRYLLPRPRLYELVSEVGFIRVFAVFHDFVFAPLTPRLVWLLRGLSVVAENMPGVRTFAGSILLHAQKPPHKVERPSSPLCDHSFLRGAVSVVIPCHNEEMNIKPLVDRLRELYGDYLHEIIPVDDNSTDTTREVLKQLASEDDRIRPIFRNPPNGVGRALADGYRAATGRYVLSMDCDFQHLLPQIRDLFDAAAQGYDLVLGSRFSRHSVLLNYPFQKIVANRGFHILVRYVLRWRVRDATNNLKLVRHDVLRELRLLEPGFAANAETGLQPLLMGRRVKEVPISWINRAPDMGTSSFQLARVGGGYWRVLRRMLLARIFGVGAYAGLRGSKAQPRTSTRASEVS